MGIILLIKKNLFKWKKLIVCFGKLKFFFNLKLKFLNMLVFFVNILFKNLEYWRNKNKNI